ncbi:MAG TPA: EAL domain-containing protein [Vicinamibacterales bacterium]|nr:EAL domain-containing protein [Vicinamibacterales bacterium]
MSDQVVPSGGVGDDVAGLGVQDAEIAMGRERQPLAVTLFVWAIIAAACAVLVLWGPRSLPDPSLFVVLLAASALASSLQLKLPLGSNSFNLSISYSVDFAALLLIGTELTMLVAGISAGMQSTFGHNGRNPVSRTVFNAAALVLTVKAAGTTFEYLGGHPGVIELKDIARPLVASALVYYIVNTSIVAAAVGLANRRPVWSVWQSNFLWTAPSYYVGAGAAVACVVFWQTKQWWLLPLTAAPVYLTFRSYRMYVDRLASEKRHKEEVLRLHTNTVAALEAARRSEQRYALAAAGSNDGLWDWDVATDTLYCSDRWKLMIGLSQDNASVSSVDAWLSLVEDEDKQGVWQALRAHLTGQRSHFEHEYRMKHADGSIRWVLCRGIAVRDATGQALRLAGSQTDITEQRRTRDSLAQAARHDALTDLPNRTLFRELLQRAMAQNMRAPFKTYAVLFIDLDGFKLVNDTHGHVVGDRFLKAIGERLQSQLRPGEALARLGGDEFAVLTQHFDEPREVRAIAERLLRALAEPFPVSGLQLRGAASIGIVIGDPKQRSVDAVLRDADIAMYRAKAAGRGGYELFDPEMHASDLKRLTFETELRRAVEQNDFTVFYQPVVHLKSGRITGLEALVRWVRADGHVAPPSEFITVAEETGLIVQLTYQVLREACHQMAAWQQMFSRPLDLSVNLSSKLFTRPEFIDQVASAIAGSGLLPGTLRLEIPESVLIDHSDVVDHNFERLRRLKVAVLLDNFGSGYASLSYLQRYRVDALKLDKSLVARMGTPDDDMASVIVKLAGALGMGLIAEGVETAEHAEQLRALDCPHAQGYLFSAPLAASDVTALLSKEFIVQTLPAAS